MTFDMDSDSESLHRQHATKTTCTIKTNCDNASPICEENGDQSLIDAEDTQYMVLRSLSKSQPSEMGKKIKPVADDSYSDHENNLVIDCDSPTDENDTPLSLVIAEKSADKKNMLLPMDQNNSRQMNGISYIADCDENLVLKVSKVNKSSVGGLQTKWLKAVKLHKGLKKKKKKKKVLKRLFERRKAMQKAKENTVIEKKEQEDVKEQLTGETSVCPVCHEEFLDAHSFTLHIREHNTDKTTHVCIICSKQLSSASSLDRHMYVHSGERPFQCTICKLRFTTNGNMHRHIKIHEANDSEKPEGRNQGKRVKRLSDGKLKEPLSENSMESSESNLYSKRKRTNPFLASNSDTSLKCQVCGKSFLSTSNLESHMKFHSDDPINCSECSITFKNYTEYSSHSCIKTFDPSQNKTGFFDLTFVEFSSSKFPIIAKQICEKQSRNPSSAFFSWECLKCSKAFPSSKSLLEHEVSHINLQTCHTCDCSFTSSKCFHNHQLKHRQAEDCMNNNGATINCAEKLGESQKEDFLAMLQLCNKNKSHEVPQKPDHKVEQFDGMQYFVHSLPLIEPGNDFADIKSIISLTSKTPLDNLRASPVTASPASPPESTGKRAPKSPEGSANHSFEANQSVEEGLSSTADEDGSSSSRYNCKKCSQTFSCSTSLKHHMRVHLKTNTLHHCGFCDYKSVDKSTLKRHLRKHNGEHPFKCSICDYVFTTKANGHRHVRNKHKLTDHEASDVIIYNPNMLEVKESDNLLSESSGSETVCKYCKQDFKYNRVLRHHLRSLNNSCSRKPYSCSICRQGFSTKNNCIRHITNHHAEYKDKAKELVVANENVNQTNETSEPPSSPKGDSSEGEAVTSPPLTEPLNLILAHKESLGPMELEDNEYPGSDPEMVSVAKSLVSLSEALPLQDKPLDLSICALNLSLKDASRNSQSSELMADGQHALNLSFSVSELLDAAAISDGNSTTPQRLPPTSHESPINLANASMPLNLTKKTFLPLCLVPENKPKEALICLPQVISPINCVISSKPTLPVVFSAHNIPVLQAVASSPNDKCGSKNQNAQLQKVKKFACEICLKGFTLKSNRERHIKNHHPEYARPPRSRNYIPTLSSTYAQKQNGATLSEKTRDALRVALIAKTKGSSFSRNSKSKKDSTPVNTPKKTSTVPPNVTIGNQKLVSFIDSEPNPSKTDDLASVSEVIDTVNCQSFKQYLIDANEISEKNKSNGVTLTDTHMDGNAKRINLSAENNKHSSYTKSNKSVYCTYCHRRFPWKSSLSRHFLTHTGQKPHECPNCPLCFTTKSNRDRHLHRQHKGAAKVAIQTNSFKCSSCSSSFSTMSKLKKHISAKHTSKPSQDLSSMLSAAETDNDLQILSSNVPDQHCDESQFSNDSLSSENVADSLECHVCKNSFKSQHDLLSHLKEVHPLECAEEMADDGSENAEDNNMSGLKIKLEPEDDVVEDLEVSDEQTSCRGDNSIGSLLSCSKCSLQFTTTAELKEHSQLHISVPSCSKSLTLKGLAKVLNGGAKERLTLPKISTPLPKTPNSLLYLIAASHSSAMLNNSPNPPNEESANETLNGDNTLISDLLGFKDPDFVEELLDSAVRSIVKKEQVDKD